MKVELKRRGKGKYLANKVAAYEPGVQLGLQRTAYEIAEVASGLLSERHGKTKRHHSLPPPRIVVEKGKKLDWFVMLEAEAATPGAALARAISIEYGHWYEDEVRNPSGPWGQSQGLRILDDAALYVSIFKGW